MPEVPGFIANFFEPKFAKPAEVTSVTEFTPRLRLVRFEGAALQGVKFRPGMEIEFRVSERAFRHYTPSFFDSDSGMLEVIFYLHGHGPGSAWAQSLRKNRKVNVLGPGGNFRLREGAARHIFLGDETALGLFACLTKVNEAASSGILEMEPDLVEWPEKLGTGLRGAPRHEGNRGDALASLIRNGGLQLAKDCAFYLVGHAGSIKIWQRALSDQGVAKQAIRSRAYWIEGKKGL